MKKILHKNEENLGSWGGRMVLLFFLFVFFFFKHMYFFSVCVYFNNRNLNN